jgi:hypothetical protein
MELDLELFEDGGAEYTGKDIHVTLYVRGNIFFNGNALAAIGDPDAVALSYDRRQSIIGVQPVPPSRNCAFHLHRKHPNRNGRKISAKNFCRRYSIHPDQTYAFKSPTVNKDGILLLDMNSVRSVRRK